MKLIAKPFLSALLFTAVVTGCYKDKGNYDYTAVNKVDITASTTDIISILQQDTLRINISFAESIPSTSGYDYDWTLYQNIQAPLTRWTLGTGKNLAAQITQPPGQYVLDYFAKDKATGISYRKKFTINIVSKLNEGWLVLEEKDGGCDLNMITPIDSIFKNIYSASNAGAKFPVGSHRIKVLQDRTNVQKIYVLSPSAVTQMYFADFLKLASFNDLFWGAPTTVKPQEYFINSSDEVLVNNNLPHGMSTIVPAPYKMGLQPIQNVSVEPFEMYTVSSGYVFFDKNSQSFMKYNLTDMVPYAAQSGTAAFNVNNVGKKLIFSGINTGGNVFSCLFKNNTNDSMFVYQMNPALATPALNAYYMPPTTAPGLLTATKFETSRLLPHMYYVNGNKVYLLDLPAQTSRVVYTFPAGTEVTAMRMYYNSKVTTDVDNNKLLAIATMEGTAGKVYTFPIAATGDFTGATYRKMYTGFGKITDIAFKRAP